MTLIDKAEALAVLRKAQIASCNCEIKTPDPEWHSHTCRYRILREAEAMIDHLPDTAIPARGVGVKPLVWQPIVKGARRPVGLVLLYRKSVTAEDKLVAAICKGTPETSDEILLGKWRDGAWRQWHTGWTVNGVTHWMTLPEPPEILAALAPTDALHVNETPKTEHDASNVLTDYTLAPHLQKIVDGASTAPQWDTQADRLAPTDAAQAREAALVAIKSGFWSAAPGEWRVGDIERVTDAILRAMDGRDG